MCLISRFKRIKTYEGQLRGMIMSNDQSFGNAFAKKRISSVYLQSFEKNLT